MPTPMPSEEPTDPPPRRRPTPRRAVAAALAVLVPLIPVFVALFLHGGAPRAAAVQTTRTEAFTPVPGSAHAAAQRSSRRSVPSPRSGPALPAGSGALIGYVARPTALRVRPGGRAFAELETRTSFGSPTWVLVRRVRVGWLGVITTAAGNNRIAWIRSADVDLARNAWSIHAHLSRHRLDVYRDGRLVVHFPIAIGAPSSPTPTGLFAVTDRLTTGDPEGPYGCCILALSAKAPHKISGWDGGNRIAIHSTPETSSIGYSVSHGCMRLSLADGEWLIRHIPLATPVRVSSA